MIGDGTVERYKARLVARKYTQQLGIDYMETFSQVVKMTTIKWLLALAASREWFIHQLDINSVFFYGDLIEEVYMEPLPCFQVPHGYVCKLNRSLYSLKQASRQ